MVAAPATTCTSPRSSRMSSVAPSTVTEYPNVMPTTVQVRAADPGANPQVIADTVATPLETELTGLPDLQYMGSNASGDGRYLLTLTFSADTDPARAETDTQNRVARALPRLPAEVQKLGVVSESVAPDMLMVVHLTSPQGRYDLLHLSNFAQLQVRDALLRVPVDGLIDKVAAFDPYVGGMLRLIRAFGLRKREAIMFRPNECVVNFADTGLPLAEKQGEDDVWIRQGAKGGRPRFVPMNTPRRRQAVASAQRIAFWDSHAHTGDPDRDLKQNMVRFGCVLRKFGITSKGLGITAHGLRHEALIEEYIAITGQEPPLRGGGEGLTREQEDAARLAVSRLAGHNRGRASAANLGAVLHKKKGGAPGGADGGAAGGAAAA